MVTTKTASTPRPVSSNFPITRLLNYAITQFIITVDLQSYCREIESYLCQKNDGHLIRVVGPSFELVSKWATGGVPFKVACAGIDRYFERYYRQKARRRPVKIDFCEADVLDLYDEWRRATGLAASQAVNEGAAEGSARKGPSLPEHLERALTRLSSARALGRIGPSADPLIDEVSMDLDLAKRASGGLRGDARKALTARLSARDAALAAIARDALDADALDALRREAGNEMQAFRDQMTPERLAHAIDVAVDRLVRMKLGLPTLAFH